MKTVEPFLVVAVSLLALGCGSPPKAEPREPEPKPQALLEAYEGVATTAEDAERPVFLKFLETTGAARGVLSVDEELGYALEVEVGPSGAIVATTSPPRCIECEAPALTLEGLITDGMFRIDTVTRLDGDAALPFVDLRLVPHDGVKPVTTPVFEIAFDPAPVAGLYVGRVFAVTSAGHVDTECGLWLAGDPVTVQMFECDVLSGADESLVVWDEARSVLNAAVGPQPGIFIAARLVDDAGVMRMTGVVASGDVPSTAISPEDVRYEDLLGTVTFAETGQ